MTGWFFFMIYVGGLFAEVDEPIGWGSRLFWPAGLGIALLRWSLKQSEPTP